MILVFGKSGQLAQSFQATMPQHLEGQTVYVSSLEANFEEPKKLAGFLDKYGPEIVVVCSAYTQVDKAEEERELAESLNAKAPQEIARWCGKNDALMIHFSTDYVYSGEGAAAWVEASPTGPKNWYGETKLQGDEAIQNSGCRHLIFRTSWVFSEYGKNFVRTMLKFGKDKVKMQVVNDQIGNPTYAPALAEAVWTIIQRVQSGERFQSGVYHAAGIGETSWAGFAEAIFSEARTLKMPIAVEILEGIPSSAYPTAAQRPSNSRLNQAKFLHHFGFQLPTWRDSLNLCLRRIRSLG
jgi:dTDP-4-dehydrorhamnose reductase